MLARHVHVAVPGRGKLNPGPGASGVHGPAWNCQKASWSFGVFRDFPVTSQSGGLTPSPGVGAELVRRLLTWTGCHEPIAPHSQLVTLSGP